jgi:hypothetical protein
LQISIQASESAYFPRKSNPRPKANSLVKGSFNCSSVFSIKVEKIDCEASESQVPTKIKPILSAAIA